MSDNARAAMQSRARNEISQRTSLPNAVRSEACRRRISRLEVWWSQTGSNRRPPAWKAGALPTELWPRQGSDIRNQNSDIWSWWAWEDLNFRPHAYQARALTN